MSPGRTPEKWSFEMSAEDGRQAIAFGVPASRPHSLEHVRITIEWRSDERRAVRGHAVLEQHPPAPGPGVTIGVGEVDVSYAVDLQVDEARREQAAPEITRARGAPPLTR